MASSIESDHTTGRHLPITSLVQSIKKNFILSGQHREVTAENVAGIQDKAYSFLLFPNPWDGIRSENTASKTNLDMISAY